MASQGDPRVLLVLNLLLSAGFSAVVVWGLDFVGVLTYSLETVALGTAVLMVLTWLMIMR